jgi:predicted GIY-YIG superfamily endonuclease
MNDFKKQLPRGSEESNGWVYIIRNESTGLYKIGVTIDLKRRVRQIQNIGGCICTVSSAIELCESTSTKEEIEEDIHALFDHKRIISEWFELSEDQIQTAKEIISELKGRTLVIDNKVIYGNISK